jgi:hypothetical protein
LLASLGSKGKNRNSLACLRNACSHSGVTYCTTELYVPLTACPTANYAAQPQGSVVMSFVRALSLYLQAAHYAIDSLQFIAQLARCRVARKVCLDGFRRIRILPGCRKLSHGRFELDFLGGLDALEHLVLFTVGV